MKTVFLRRDVTRRAAIWLAGLCLLAVPACAQPQAVQDSSADEQVGSTGKGPRFDGVYAVALDTEKDALGQPRWIAVRLYEDGTTVEAEFHGDLADCSGWLSRDNEGLLPGRWRMEGDVLTVLESTGLTESERSGQLGAGGWTTTPRVRVNESNGWRLEPAARVGEVPLLFEFRRVKFAKGQGQAADNRRPYFQGVGSHDRNYDYDRAGNLIGINEEVTVQADDPDQDPLTFTWTVSSGSVNGEGPKAVWERKLVNGRPEPGTIGVEVTDGRGGIVSQTWDSENPTAGGWTYYQAGGTGSSQPSVADP